MWTGRIGIGDRSFIYKPGVDLALQGLYGLKVIQSKMTNGNILAGI